MQYAELTPDLRLDLKRPLSSQLADLRIRTLDPRFMRFLEEADRVLGMLLDMRIITPEMFLDFKAKIAAHLRVLPKERR